MSNEHFDRLARYFDGDMSDSEKQELEQDLVRYSALRAEMEKHNTAQEFIERGMEHDLRNQFKAWKSDKAKESKPARIRPLFRRLAVAATLGLLLLAAGYLWVDTTFDSVAMADHRYQEAPTPLSRSAENQTVILIEGFTAYRNQNWDEAITALDKVDVSNPSYSEAKYFLGHAYYQNGQYEEAAEVFQIPALIRDVRFEEDAEWYTVISLLADRADRSSLLDALQSILEEENHSYHQQAIRLQRKIRGFGWRLANGAGSTTE